LTSLSNVPVIICKEPVIGRYFRSFLGWGWVEYKSSYVVGYSDGTAEMLLPDQFQALDLTGFVPLASLGVEGLHVHFDEKSFKP
jgi:hypothetical protein